MKTLHVLFTGLVSSKMLSGGDQLFLDIAPRLPKDIRIIIITPYFAKKHWDDIDQTNIEFRLLSRNIFDFKDHPLLIFFSYVVRSWQTYVILRKEAVQKIYSCSDIAYADIWPAFLISRGQSNVSWLSRVYHVLLPPATRQGSYLVNIIAFRLQRLSFWMMKRESSVILALNPQLHKELLGLNFPKDKLDILGAGIDFKRINDYIPSRKYPYDVVLLGRIAPVKGIFDSIKIWSKVHDISPSLKLAWIGGGGENYNLKMNEMISEYNLEDSFHMLGFIEKTEVYNILKNAKVFLCTDHEIGWGLAVCEAMASGLPVIAYNTDVFGGIYKKGFITVPLFDTDSFADELIKLVNDEDRRKKIANDAVAQAKEFDHQQVIDGLVKYLI